MTMSRRWYHLLATLDDMGILAVPEGCELTLASFSLRPSTIHNRRMKVWMDGVRTGRLGAERDAQKRRAS